MGSPLDDLRKISNQVEKKKEENLKNIEAHKKLEKDILSEGTVEQQKQRMLDSQVTVKRAERLKLLVIVFSFLLVGALIFFIVKYVIFASTPKSLKVGLVSDGFLMIDDKSEDHLKITKFINEFIDKYKVSAENTTVPWYQGVSEEKRVIYKQVLDTKLNLPEMHFIDIKNNKETGSYQVWFKDNSGNSLVFNLVKNDNYDLNIVKIF